MEPLLIVALISGAIASISFLLMGFAFYAIYLFVSKLDQKMFEEIWEKKN